MAKRRRTSGQSYADIRAKIQEARDLLANADSASKDDDDEDEESYLESASDALEEAIRLIEKRGRSI